MMNVHHDAWINIHTYIISSLICVALATNVIFLMSLKSDKSKINNNEKIQVYKTTLVILAIVCYIPTELFVMHEGYTTYTISIVKGM